MRGRPSSRTARPLPPLRRTRVKGGRRLRPTRQGERPKMSTAWKDPDRGRGHGAAGAAQAVQSLLYGRSVDRTRKTQARLGLALVGFALVYAIIAGRLVIYALAADSHLVRRAVASDAVATARPDILDRNGEVLATDLMTP